MTTESKLLEARDILAQVGMPRAQRNDRSAWTLLALGDVRPDTEWQATAEPTLGITPIMSWIAQHYGKQYAPNTRETVRRQTIHQFVAAGIALYNSDEPDRAVNSPKAGYKLTPEALTLLRSYSGPGWGAALSTFLAVQPTLAARYAAERDMEKVPVRVPGGAEITLSPGAHSDLIRAIVDNFAAIHTPGAKLIYVGDTGEKVGFFDKAALGEIGVKVDTHGKLPDVVLFDERRGWLVLIESVTSHGSVDGKRHAELQALFASSTAGLVFVSAFPTRQVMGRFLGALAWETEVWVADAPTHLVHFNGDRFLGPH